MKLENITSEIMLLEIYIVGFKDGLNGIANNLFVSEHSRQAYLLGRTDAMLGRSKILERIINIYPTIDIKPALTTTDFINFGLDHISEIDDSLNNEKTYNKVISRDEVYTFVHHSDTSELCISVHGIHKGEIINYERLFKGIINNIEDLKNVITYTNLSSKIK